MKTTKGEIIRKLQDNESYLSSNYGLQRIGIFGSYLKGTPNENSDIDIIVEFKEPVGLKFLEVSDFLENLLGKKIDILTPAGIKSIRNPKVAQTIKESVVYV